MIDIIFNVILFDRINFFMSVVACIDILLFLVVSRSKSTYKYLIHLICIIIWILFMMIFRYSKNLYVSILMSDLLYFTAILIPYTFTLFILEFKKNLLGKYLVFKKYLHMVTIAYFIAFFYSTEKIILMLNSEKKVIFKLFNLPFIILGSIYFTFCFYLIYVWYKNGTNEEVAQSKIFFYGSSVAVFFSMICNVGLPSLGIFDFNWAGQVSSLFLTSCVFYAVLRYKLFDIKIFTAKFVKYLFFSIYGYTTFYGLTFMYNTFFGSVVAKQALIFGAVMAPLFAYFLFRLDKLTDSLNYFIFGNLNRHQDILESILNYVNANLEEEKIIKFTDNVLSGFLESTGTHLINLPEKDEKLNEIIKEIFIENREVYILEDKKEVYKYILEKWPNVYCAAKFKTKSNDEYIFYVENKKDEQFFSKADILLVKSVVNQLEYAIDRSDLYQKTKDYNEELKKEVSGKTQSIEIQKQTLEKMLEEKEETLHVVAHQVKTPLSVMRSALQMWRDGIWSGEKSEEVLKTEVDRLADTIDVFFKAQQRVNGERVLDLKNGDIVFLIKEIIKEKKIMKRVRDENIKINFVQSSENIKQFKFDIHQVTEIISNIIDNAVNYTKDLIEVYVERVDENILIKVKDNGIGIKKEDIGKLFNRFIRAENAVKHRPDGSGLGLYVVKQIVELHKGRIWVESEGIDKGSTFFVSLHYEF